MTYNAKQRELIKKYKEEFLKNKENKRLVDEIKSERMKTLRLEKSNEEKVKKAEDVVKIFAKKAWDKNSKIKKEFGILDDWTNALMGELGLLHFSNI